MAESKKQPAAKKSEALTAGAVDETGTWKPTPESKKQATTLRIWTAVLWVLAIAAEAVAIFWVLGRNSPFNEAPSYTTNPDGTLAVSSGGFSTTGVVVLIAFLVVDAILVIIANQLWKKANHLDPASKSNALRFFVQNQLGAIIAVVAFLPVIILIFTNKNMSSGQKALAGVIGIVIAAAAVWSGVDVHPASTEQYSAESTAVIQILGQDKAYWGPSSTVYHVCENVSDLSGSDVRSGTTAEAVAALATPSNTPRLTLKLESELKACDKAVPTNIDDIVAALKNIQAGQTNTVLPAPTWSDPSQAPDLSQILGGQSDDAPAPATT